MYYCNNFQYELLCILTVILIGIFIYYATVLGYQYLRILTVVLATDIDAFLQCVLQSCLR